MASSKIEVKGDRETTELGGKKERDTVKPKPSELGVPSRTQREI